MNPITWLLSKLSPVPRLDYDLVKWSAPNDETRRVKKFDGDPKRHEMKRAPLTIRTRRGAA